MGRTKKATEAPIDRLEAMLARLQLSGIRDQFELLDERARANLSARETLILLFEHEIARKDHRRIAMGLKLGREGACGPSTSKRSRRSTQSNPRVGRITLDLRSAPPPSVPSAPDPTFNRHQEAEVGAVSS
ncbi:hypothetical protein [Bradyrhizobium zhanjiangense]|uniref:hypothetical protein n=1 Tax=Bradyrhizobium zhanjiangense TaxID=1325107 RepID=UPI0019D6E5A3|nr:hypothetical protein [Bradyrhizobium zhanjiangense]